MDEQQPFALPVETAPETPQFSIGDKVSCIQTIGKTTYGPYVFTIDKILPADKAGVVRVSGSAQDGKKHTVPQKICTKITTLPATPTPAAPTPAAPTPDPAAGTGLLPAAPTPAPAPPAPAPPAPTPAPPAPAPPAPAPPAPTPALPSADAAPTKKISMFTSPLSDDSPDTWPWTPIPENNHAAFNKAVDDAKAGDAGLKIVVGQREIMYYMGEDDALVLVSRLYPAYLISDINTRFPELKPFYFTGGKTYRKILSRSYAKKKTTRRMKKY